MKKISTSGYAVLGLLADRPWSAYELTKYMKESNVRLLWPSAESKLYETPKQLEKAGLAKGTQETVNGRKRTSYEITPAGRKALVEWLGQPAGHLKTEFEAGLQISFASVGSLDQLDATLSRLQQHVIADFPKEAAEVIEILLTQGMHLPKRTHTVPLIARLFQMLNLAQGVWLNWAKTTIQDWDSSDIDDEKRAWAYAELEDVLRSMRNIPIDLEGEMQGTLDYLIENSKKAK